jgi:hypothetical protein
MLSRTARQSRDNRSSGHAVAPLARSHIFGTIEIVVVLEGKSAAKTFGLALAIWKRSSFLSTSRKALPLANLFDWHQNSAPRGELSVAIW